MRIMFCRYLPTYTPKRKAHVYVFQFGGTIRVGVSSEPRKVMQDLQSKSGVSCDCYAISQPVSAPVCRVNDRISDLFDEHKIGAGHFDLEFEHAVSMLEREDFDGAIKPEEKYGPDPEKMARFLFGKFLTEDVVQREARSSERLDGVLAKVEKFIDIAAENEKREAEERRRMGERLAKKRTRHGAQAEQ